MESILSYMVESRSITYSSFVTGVSTSSILPPYSSTDAVLYFGMTKITLNTSQPMNFDMIHEGSMTPPPSQ